MSVNNQEECGFSEWELFKCPFVQSNILNRKFKKIYPITKLQDFGLTEFLIENVTDHFLDKDKVTLTLNSRWQTAMVQVTNNYHLNVMVHRKQLNLNGYRKQLRLNGYMIHFFSTV